MRVVEAAEEFLADYDGPNMAWQRPAGAPVAIETNRLMFGSGDSAFEVAVGYSSMAQPKVEELRSLFKKRQGGQGRPCTSRHRIFRCEWQSPSRCSWGHR
jgi:hypothetical protein